MWPASWLDLLGGGSLQVNVVAFTLAEGGDHLVGGAGIDGLDGLEIETPLETGVVEHGERLAAVIDDDFVALELVPAEGLVGAASGEEEAVLLVDLSEVHRRRLLALLERTETLGRRRLGHVHRAVDEAAIADLPGGDELIAERREEDGLADALEFLEDALLERVSRWVRVGSADDDEPRMLAGGEREMDRVGARGAALLDDELEVAVFPPACRGWSRPRRAGRRSREG